MNVSTSVLAAAADLDITYELDRRSAPGPCYQREKEALQYLARCMAEDPERVAPCLSELALKLCEADSAGISVLEGDEFRWLGLAGKLAVFEGSKTPRNDSPCGTCIDKRAATLMRYPERAYAWIADAKITVPEVLLVPIVRGERPLGTLWVVAKPGHQFNSDHARVLGELAAFAGSVLGTLRADEELKKSLAEQEIFAREMSHRVKNFFALTEGLVRMTARHSTTKEEMVENLLRRLIALSDAHALAQQHKASHVQDPVPLRIILETVLRPYREPVLIGPDALLTPSATSNMTLVLHELATNAAKYGALSAPDGEVEVEWSRQGDFLNIVWKETGGPELANTPEPSGFGTKLLQAVITSLDATLHKTWTSSGLTVRMTIPSKCVAE